MTKNFYFLSGLPRSGSTVLSAILSQNPNIHAEGNSALCQLMWDMQESCEKNANQQLMANYRYSTQNDIIQSLPFIYYKNVLCENIVDKCRSWTLPANMIMIRKYITNNPKVIILTRPINEILNSFSKLNISNNLSGDVSMMKIPGSEPVMRSNDGVMFAKNSKDKAFLFIEYNDLCENPQEVMDKIYDHCGWEKFNHDFDNVVNLHHEDDSVYGLIGMHDIRKKVGKV